MNLKNPAAAAVWLETLAADIPRRIQYLVRAILCTNSPDTSGETLRPFEIPCTSPFHRAIRISDRVRNPSTAGVNRFPVVCAISEGNRSGLFDLALNTVVSGDFGDSRGSKMRPGVTESPGSAARCHSSRRASYGFSKRRDGGVNLGITIRYTRTSRGRMD